MKGIMLIALLVMLMLVSSPVYACWGGYGMGFGTTANTENVKKFQKETLSLRDNLITKGLELQNEYSKPSPDANRIAALRKEIIDIQSKIQNTAKKYGLSGWDVMGSSMWGNMMGMCNMRWW